MSQNNHQLTPEKAIINDLRVFAYSLEELTDKKLFYKLLETYSNHLLELIEEAKKPIMINPNVTNLN